MFYKEEDISKELVCPKCTNRFEDPRILPCGNSLCQSCIINEISEGAINKCYCCQEKHSVPKEGEFTKNKFILKQLEKTPIEVKRGALGEKLKNSIITLTDKKEELENYLKSGDQKVSDYLGEIRIQIDIITETQIERMNKARDALLDKLKQYQTECMYSKRTNKIELLKEFDEYNEKMSKYLKGNDWNETYVNDQIKEAKNLVDLCAKAKENFEKEIFLNKKPTFIPSTTTLNETETIGKLTFDIFVTTEGVLKNQENLSVINSSLVNIPPYDRLHWISNFSCNNYGQNISFCANAKWCYQLSDLKTFILILDNVFILSESVFLFDSRTMKLTKCLGNHGKLVILNSEFYNDNLFLNCMDSTSNLYVFMCRYENGKLSKLCHSRGSNQTSFKECHLMAANDTHLYCFHKAHAFPFRYNGKKIRKQDLTFTIPTAERAKRIKVDSKFFYILKESSQTLDQNINNVYVYNVKNGDHLMSLNDRNLIDISLIEDGLIAGLYLGNPFLMIDVYDFKEKTTTKKRFLNLPLQDSNVELVCFSKDNLILLNKKYSIMIIFSTC